MRKHYVTFLCPGTFMSEQRTEPIDAWSLHEAAARSSRVVERWGATPYAFFFITRLEAASVPDGEGGMLRVMGREVERSAMHHMHATVRSIDELQADRSGRDLTVLLSNMRGNGWPLVAESIGRYRHFAPYERADVCVDERGSIVDRGDSPEHVEYRARKLAEWEQE